MALNHEDGVRRIRSPKHPPSHKGVSSRYEGNALPEGLGPDKNEHLCYCAQTPWQDHGQILLMPRTLDVTIYTSADVHSQGVETSDHRRLKESHLLQLLVLWKLP